MDHKKNDIMITEDYVSFETAKLLKEKGFDVYVSSFYNNDGELSEKEAYWNWNVGSRYSAPTLQMAMKWLREEHNCHIQIIRGAKGYYPWIQTIPLGVSKVAPSEMLSNRYTETYEEACEAAVKYCLENLI